MELAPMSHGTRLSRAPTTTIALVIQVAAPTPIAIAAPNEKSPAAAPPGTTAASRTGTWTPPRTPWGDPDLQGIYTSATYTPLERPPEFAGREFFTAAEAAAFAQKSLKELFDQSADAIHYDDAIWQSESTPQG